jgi:imidazolonepropionase-like amidohydrolase
MPSMQIVIGLSIYYLEFRPIKALAYSTTNLACSLNLFDRGLKADLIIWDLENVNQLGYYLGYNRAYRIIKESKILNF